MEAAAVALRYRRSGRGRGAFSGASDERLVARVRAGDDGAFEAIYDRYHGGLLAFCRHMLGSREEAEDVLQHSFVSAYRALRSSEGEICLRPWLYTIARNRCLSVLRTRRELVDVDELRPVAPELDGLASQVQRRSELRELVIDMQRLPEDQRAALVLFELGDHNHAEIAQVLGVRKDKVKALVFQAREELARARRARDTPCEQIRQQLAIATGAVPRRSALRRHLDGCPGCRHFAAEVRGQRNAFAAILPVVPTIGLKTAVLGSAIGGSGAAAMGAGVGGAAVATGAGVGASAGGGGAVCSGVGAASAAGGVSATSIATGITVVGAGASSIQAGLAGLGGKAAVAKILTVVAASGGAAGSQGTAGDRPAVPTTTAPVVQHAPVPFTTAPPTAASAPIILPTPAPVAAPSSTPPEVASPAAAEAVVAPPLPPAPQASSPPAELITVTAPASDIIAGSIAAPTIAADTALRADTSTPADPTAPSSTPLVDTTTAPPAIDQAPLATSVTPDPAPTDPAPVLPPPEPAPAPDSSGDAPAPTPDPAPPAG